MRKIFFTILLLTCGCYGDYCQKALEVGDETKKIFEKLTYTLAKQCHLILLVDDGIGCIIDEKDVIWCTKYMVQGHAMKLEEVRPIAEQAFHYLYKNVMSEQVFHDFVYYSHKLLPNLYKEKLTAEHIGLRIDFWDENVDRYLFPYVSKVIVTGDEVRYYYADPKTQALQEPVREKLPECVLKGE